MKPGKFSRRKALAGLVEKIRSQPEIRRCNERQRSKAKGRDRRVEPLVVHPLCKKSLHVQIKGKPQAKPSMFQSARLDAVARSGRSDRFA